MASIESRAELELERRVVHLEEKGAGLLSYDEIVNGDTVAANVAFARQLQLISEEQAREFSRRILATEEHRKRLERTETRIIVNDLENPLEREQRYLDMDRTSREARDLRNTRVNHQGERGSAFRQGDTRFRSSDNN